MEYFIIILVIGLALAPLSHFVPSKRQRQVARMRETAAVRGLFVEFRDLPTDRRGNAAGATDGASRGRIIYYGKRLPPARGDVDLRDSWVVDEQGWRSLRGTRKPPGILGDLPGEVLAASVDEGSCGIYWAEAGEEAELVQIIAVLEDWARQLRP
jgi:hypothetical protein